MTKKEQKKNNKVYYKASLSEGPGGRQVAAETKGSQPSFFIHSPPERTQQTNAQTSSRKSITNRQCREDLFILRTSCFAVSGIPLSFLPQLGRTPEVLLKTTHVKDVRRRPQRPRDLPRVAEVIPLDLPQTDNHLFYHHPPAAHPLPLERVNLRSLATRLLTRRLLLFLSSTDAGTLNVCSLFSGFFLGTLIEPPIWLAGGGISMERLER